jgi:hypothetical protein|tara:strand:+ start:768 stop:932 length:165 start_codon:yes stop_codon:yes gene_type:complete
MKKIGLGKKDNYWTVTGTLENLKVEPIGDRTWADRHKRMQIQHKIIRHKQSKIL